MFVRRKASALALAAAFAFAWLAPAAGAAVRPTQSEQRRRTQGPVAGPAIKLPPGTGAQDDPPQAQGAKEQGARDEAVPLKWEYCVISGFRYRQSGLSISSPTRTPAAHVRYLPAGSEEIEGANEEEALGNAFAKLGEDGWELAGVRTEITLKEGDGKSSTVYFFKRPRRRE